MLAQLRSAGHQVSLVEDADEARLLLGFAGFDQAVLPAAQLSALLEWQCLWESADTDAWRRSTAALAHDLQGLLHALERSIAEAEASVRGTRLGDFHHTISTLASFLHELTMELGGRGHEDLALTDVDLEDAVEAAAVVVYPSASERRQRLVIDIDDSVPKVYADSVKLKRILTNLLEHASRHAPRAGTVTVRACADQGDCVISVSHAGDGATQADLRRLFGPDAGKNGLPSLSRVQRLVEQHGGRLWIESQKGQGTTAFVSLPLGAEESGRPLAHLARD